MTDLGECDTCACVATHTVFYHGKPVGKRCPDCLQRLEDRIASGDVDVSDDPLDGIHLTTFRRGYVGEA